MHVLFPVMTALYIVFVKHAGNRNRRHMLAHVYGCPSGQLVAEAIADVVKGHMERDGVLQVCTHAGTLAAGMCASGSSSSPGQPT